MSFVPPMLRIAPIVAALCVAAARFSHAQNAAGATPAPKHPAVCAKGVRIYTEKNQVPTPYDTLTIPPADGPIRVTSPEEAEAAELALRGRAGSVGATGVLLIDEVSEESGQRRVSRQATGIYVPADSARAQQACK